MKRRACKRCGRIRVAVGTGRELHTGKQGATLPCVRCLAWAGAETHERHALAFEYLDPGLEAARQETLAKPKLSVTDIGDMIKRKYGADKPQPDPVNNPAHYTQGGVQVIEAIEAWQLGFRLGSAVKYIARAGKKDPAKLREDLQKARWYLDRELASLGADAKDPAIDAEQALLGGIMLDNSALERVTGLVRTGDFSNPNHATIFDAILALRKRNEPVDDVTLVNALQMADKLAQIGGWYICNLVERIPTAANIEAYAKIVRDSAAARKSGAA